MLRFILIFCVALLSWKSNYAHKRYKGKAVDLQIEKWDNSEMAVGYMGHRTKRILRVGRKRHQTY